MSEEVGLFNLAGYRFSKMLIDDSGLGTGGETVALTTKVESETPYLSKEKSSNRTVIEITLSLRMERSAESEESEDASAIVEAICVAGFLGRNEEADGNLESFAKSYPFYVRSVYWLVRQRVSNLMSMTRLRGVVLPWDIEPSVAETEG